MKKKSRRKKAVLHGDGNSMIPWLLQNRFEVESNFREFVIDPIANRLANVLEIANDGPLKLSGQRHVKLNPTASPVEKEVFWAACDLQRLLRSTDQDFVAAITSLMNIFNLLSAGLELFLQDASELQANMQEIRKHLDEVRERFRGYRIAGGKAKRIISTPEQKQILLQCIIEVSGPNVSNTEMYRRAAARYSKLQDVSVSASTVRRAHADSKIHFGIS